MRLRSFMAIGLVAWAGAGCYYESPVPLGEPGQVPFDSTIVGTWIGAGEDHDSTRMVVLRFDAHQYVISLDGGEDESNGCCLRAYLTEVGGVKFLNAQDLTEEDRPYMFFRYTRTGDRMRVRALKEKMAPTFATSAELRAFVAKNLQNDSIYENLDEIKLVPKYTR